MIRKHLFSVAMLCIALLLAGCGQDVDYMKVVPADASVVATFDCERMMKESGLLDQPATEAQTRFKEALVKDLSAGETEFMEKVFMDPSEVGVDWSKKVFTFRLADEGILAATFAVADAEKLKSSFEVFAGSRSKTGNFSDESGFSWARFRHSYVAVTDRTGVIVLTAGRDNREEIKERVATWLAQTEDQSFMGSKYYDQLLDLDGEIAVYAGVDNVPEKVTLASNMIYGAEMDLNTIHYLSDVSFEDGQVVAKGKLVIDDENIRKWLKDFADFMKKLNGKSLKSLPASTAFWTGIGIDGDDLYDHLLEHPVYGKEMEHMRLPLNIEGVIRSIDGDISVAYPHGVFVDVKNEELLKIIVGAVRTMGSFTGFGIEDLGDDQYRLEVRTRNILQLNANSLHPYIGMKDDSFYLTADSLASDALPKEESLAGAEWADEVDGNLTFTVINFSNGSKILDDLISSKKTTRLLKTYFDYVTIGAKDIENSKVVLSFKDKDRNMLEQLIEFLIQWN